MDNTLTIDPNQSPLLSRYSKLTAEHTNRTPTTPSLSTDSLCGLAGKLFSILTELKKNHQSYAADKLRPYLLQELKRFAHEAKKHNHNDEMILISQYVICRSFDTVICNLDWGQAADWQHQTLSSTLPHTEALTDNFPRALRKMCEIPAAFIDLLELIYLCLNLSETDQTRHKFIQTAYGINQQTLFQLIQSERGEHERRLSKQLASMRVSHFTHRFTPQLFRWISIGAVIILIGLYFSFNFMANETSQPLKQQIDALLMTQQGSYPSS